MTYGTRRCMRRGISIHPQSQSFKAIWYPMQGENWYKHQRYRDLTKIKLHFSQLLPVKSFFFQWKDTTIVILTVLEWKKEWKKPCQIISQALNLGLKCIFDAPDKKSPILQMRLSFKAKRLARGGFRPSICGTIGYQPLRPKALILFFLQTS